MKTGLTISGKKSSKNSDRESNWTIANAGNSRHDQRRSRENRSAKESKRQTRKPRSANPRRTITNARAASRRYRPNPQPYSPATAFPIHRQERRTTHGTTTTIGPTISRSPQPETSGGPCRTAASSRSPCEISPTAAAVGQRKRRNLTENPLRTS